MTGQAQNVPTSWHAARSGEALQWVDADDH